MFEKMGLVDSVSGVVNGKHYESLLRDKIIPIFQQHARLNRIIFKQDASPLHIAKLIIELIKSYIEKL